MADEMNLLGKVILRGKIKVVTGLSIGGSKAGLQIGGLDNPVIKDAEGRPYIPGSSLKGKMRSLLEKTEGKRFNKSIGGSRIHLCESGEDYARCSVCLIFGVPADIRSGEKHFGGPTRLIVRDASLTKDSQEKLEKLPTDFRYTELKWENVIDRITSAANPRSIERVPAGAEFDFEMIYNVFTKEDKENLRHVLKAQELLEHDYLGASGSRGYGKIVFEDIKVYWNSKEDYETGDVEKRSINGDNTTVATILHEFHHLVKEIH